MSSDLKLIKHNADYVDNPDDPTYPYRLEISFSAPEFMRVSFEFEHGRTEEIVVRSKSREALEEFINVRGYKRHPRLLKLSLTGPEGPIYTIEK